MGDLDRIDPGSVECCDDPADIGRCDAVTDGVHAIAQGDVLDEDVGHQMASRVAVRAASFSAT